MKSKNNRFKDANALVDSKIDALFQYQEKSKKPMMKKGGKLKPSYVDGTPSVFGDDPEELAAAYGFTDVGTAAKQSKVGQFLSTIDKDKLGTQLATFTPNVVNTFLQKKLKGPNTPALETTTRLKKIDPTAQITETAGDYKMALDTLSRGTGQGAALGSNIGNILAKKMSATNQIYGAVNNQNAQIQNQEAFLNQQTRARNVERINQFGQGMADFENRKKMMSSVS